MEYSLPLAFVMGLFSSLHCIGMCGGIIGALTFGLAPESRNSTPRLLLFVLSYSGGRIISYGLAGALVATFGLWLAESESIRLVLQVGSALLIILIGLYIGNLFPQLTRIERIGMPVWRRIEPLARRLHPVQRPSTALLYGLLWGWVPCGMVYSILLSGLAMRSWQEGALYMVAFGLGTLPSMTATGLFAGQIQRFTRRPLVRTASALAVIAMGAALLWHALAMAGGGHDHHGSHAAPGASMAHSADEAAGHGSHGGHEGHPGLPVQESEVPREHPASHTEHAMHESHSTHGSSPTNEPVAPSGAAEAPAAPPPPVAPDIHSMHHQHDSTGHPVQESEVPREHPASHTEHAMHESHSTHGNSPTNEPVAPSGAAEAPAAPSPPVEPDAHSMHHHHESM